MAVAGRPRGRRRPGKRHRRGGGRQHPPPLPLASRLKRCPVQRVEPPRFRTGRSPARCHFVRCDLRFGDRPGLRVLAGRACSACAYRATRVDSASAVKTLADYGKQYKGVVKILSPPSVAPDRLWRLGNRISATGWPIPAGSRLQILEKSTAKASIRPVPTLLATLEVPDCLGISNRRRP